LRQAHPVAKGWGRLRAVVLNEIKTINDNQSTVYSMSVFADQTDRPLMTNKSLVVLPNHPNDFPQGSDNGLEFRTSFQKCAYARVQLTAVPAIFNLEGLDLWVANTGDKAPTNNRS
jgi:hypothetical protein